MERPSFNDKTISPSAAPLTATLGAAKPVWDQFQVLLHSDPLISTEWRYYNDGKSWLLKVTRKKSTLCWVSVWNNYFHVTCYFNAKLENIIKSSDLFEEDKAQFVNNTKPVKLKPITIKAESLADFARITKLIALKAV